MGNLQSSIRSIVSGICIIYKAIKALFCFIISSIFCRRPKKKPTSNAAPILPIRKPTTGKAYAYDPPLPVLPREPVENVIKCHVPSREKIVSVPNSICESEEKKKAVIRSGSVDGIRWIKHYSSRHRILIVGDGDFSFSACLAVAFGRASNMIATSLDSESFLKNNYKKAYFNIMELRRRDCHVMHEFDATVMASHPVLGNFKFDRVVYNFPHSGFFKNMPRETQLQRHRRLVSLFLKNAKEMIGEDGEIHISHKTNGFHAEWNLESIAFSHGLRLIEAERFHHLEYPGYNTKYGFGGDNNFNCNPSKTYKFGIRKANN